MRGLTENLSAHGRTRRGEKLKTSGQPSAVSVQLKPVFLLFFFAFVMVSLLPFPLSKGGERGLFAIGVTDAYAK